MLRVILTQRIIGVNVVCVMYNLNFEKFVIYNARNTIVKYFNFHVKTAFLMHSSYPVKLVVSLMIIYCFFFVASFKRGGKKLNKTLKCLTADQFLSPISHCNKRSKLIPPNCVYNKRKIFEFSMKSTSSRFSSSDIDGYSSFEDQLFDSMSK